MPCGVGDMAPGKGRNPMGGPLSALSGPVLDPRQQPACPGAGVSLGAGDCGALIWTTI